MRKDDFLATLMMVPPKQKQEIKPFSQKTTREAFSVSLEGLKGVRSFVMHLHDWSTLPSPGEQRCAANACAAVPLRCLLPYSRLQTTSCCRSTCCKSSGALSFPALILLFLLSCYVHASVQPIECIAYDLIVEYQYASGRVATSSGRPEAEGT